MKDKIKILIVEDDLDTAEEIEAQLIEMGFSFISIALTYKKALTLINTGNPDLILLDVELDKKHSGIDIAYMEKVFCKIPIIYITGCEDSYTKEEFIETRPKGCLLKPVSDAQLELTISRVLSLRLNEKPVNLVLCHNFNYELTSRILTKNKVNIKLTPNEKKLLERLIDNKGTVVKSRELELAIWGYQTPIEHSLRNLVRNLKNKLDPQKQLKPEIIVNERSVGYKLC